MPLAQNASGCFSGQQVTERKPLRLCHSMLERFRHVFRLCVWRCKAQVLYEGQHYRYSGKIFERRNASLIQWSLFHCRLQSLLRNRHGILRDNQYAHHMVQRSVSCLIWGCLSLALFFAHLSESCSLFFCSRERKCETPVLRFEQNLCTLQIQF